MFRVVSTEFWTDPLVIDTFSPEDKFFMLYLLTNPHTKQCGIYQLNLKVAAFETGYSKDTISCLIERFQDKYNRIIYNYETQEIGIYNYIKHGVIRGGSPVIDCIKSDLSIIKDKTIISRVYKHMQKFYETTDKESFKSIGAVFKEYAVTYNDNVNDNDNELSYHESLHESYHDTSFKQPHTDYFSIFWSAYPRKQGKGYAEKAFKKIKNVETLIDKMITVIEQQKTDPSWQKESGMYIPMPSTWLNGRRWEDEIKTCVSKPIEKDNFMDYGLEKNT